MTIGNPYLITGAPQTLRVFAALAAAGAFDAAPTELHVVGGDHATLFLEYTRGAANGAVNMQIEFSPYSVDATAPVVSWFPMSIWSPGATVVNVTTQSLLEPELVEFGSTVATRQGSLFDILIPAYVARIRVACAEIGIVGTPGSCSLTLIVSPDTEGA